MQGLSWMLQKIPLYCEFTQSLEWFPTLKRLENRVISAQRFVSPLNQGISWYVAAVVERWKTRWVVVFAFRCLCLILRVGSRVGSLIWIAKNNCCTARFSWFLSKVSSRSSCFARRSFSFICRSSIFICRSSNFVCLSISRATSSVRSRWWNHLKCCW